jgi:hypothetical protein
MSYALALVALAGAGSACDKLPFGSKKDETEPAQAATSEASATPAPDSAAAPPTVASASAAPPASSTPAADPNAAPAMAEWTAAQPTSTKKSGQLDCHNKVIREWVRVACKGSDATKPPKMQVAKGTVETQIDEGGERGAIYKYVEGHDLAIAFTLVNDVVTYRSSWPSGKPKPAAVGEFAAQSGPRAASDPLSDLLRQVPGVGR